MPERHRGGVPPGITQLCRAQALGVNPEAFPFKRNRPLRNDLRQLDPPLKEASTSSYILVLLLPFTI